MENEHVELEDFKKPKRSFKVFWAVLITVVVMGGGGAYGYYYFDGQNKDESAELVKQVDDLRKQVEDLSGSAQEDDLDELSDEPLDPNLTTREFISSKLGLTLRYPKSYFAEEISSGENTYLIIDKKAVDSTIPADSEFPQQYFMVSKRQEACTLNTVKQSAISETVSAVKIGGVSGWKYTMTKPSDLDGSYSTNYFVNASNNCVHISVKNVDAKGTHDSAVDDIISSITLNN